MREVCFVFKNMKEASYYFRNLVLEFEEVKKESGIDFKSNPLINRITLFKKVEKKQNIIKKILIKLNILKPKYIYDNLSIYFASKQSNIFDITNKKMYFYDSDYELSYLMNEIEKLY